MAWYWAAALALLLPGQVASAVRGCVPIQGLCIGLWAVAAFVAVAAYPSLQLAVRAAGAAIARTRLVHVTHVYFALRLARRVAAFLWALLLFLLWQRLVAPRVRGLGGGGSAFERLLACHLAFRTIWLVKDFVVQEVAHRTLWAPYLARVQASIFAQYVIMMLSEFAMDGRRCGAVDQAVALQYAANEANWHNMSLYAISQAMSFVPSQRLSGAAAIQSKRTAREFAAVLFRSVIAQCARPRKGGGGGGGGAARAVRAAARPWSSVTTSIAAAERAPPTPPLAQWQVVRGLLRVDGSGGGTVKSARTSGDVGSGGGSGSGGGGTGGTVGGGSSGGGGGGNGSRAAAAEPRRRASGTDVPSGDAAAALAGVLTLRSLRPAMCKPLARKTLELLDANADATITEDEFVSAIVRVYQKRRSLSLSLQDYEIILRKLSYMLSVGFAVFLLFVCLWIFGQGVVGLGVSWVSLLLAGSFVFSTSAQGLCESFVFIFVTRPFDVGDGVHFRDDMGQDNVFVVHRINLLSTVLKRWDGQYVVWPNRFLALREIRNMRRSGPQSNTLTVFVRRDASAEALARYRDALRAAARAAPRDHALVPDSIGAAFRADAGGGTALEVCVSYTQVQSWQDANERWRTHAFLARVALTLRASLALAPDLPTQPVLLRGSGGGGGGGGSSEAVEPDAAAIQAAVAAAAAAASERVPGCRAPVHDADG
ncbi:hypothetical protein JKP88DRAFT_326968 [Tribonema minus]|uniref:EF-hand domain-containing protein n=1 Tax=Tribonema minus TaxID=303371 RepID=A0A835YTT2_9STRA|nr:hypothetical protein JKP88DRAFT_326968 [Tribonema minus]